MSASRPSRSAPGIVAALAATAVSLLAAAPAWAQGGEALYAANGVAGNPATHLFILDPTSGATLRDMGPTGAALTGLAQDPTDGVMYGVTGGGDANFPHHLFRVDLRTGAGTVVGDLFPGVMDPNAVSDITFAPDGTLYGWSNETDDLVTINKATGATTVVGDSGISTSGGGGLALSPGGTLFAAPNDADGMLYTINRTTGAATAGPTLNGNPDRSFAALAFDAGGTLFGAELEPQPGPRPADLATINTTTGAVTDLGPSLNRMDAIEFAALPPPVPRTLTLDASKNKVKKGKKVTLSGELNAPEAEPLCEAGQTVELQRKKKGQGSFKTVDQVQTDAQGNFSIKEKIKKTLQFQAVVALSSDCTGQTSNTEKVKAKKKKKKD